MKNYLLYDCEKKDVKPINTYYMSIDQWVKINFWDCLYNIKKENNGYIITDKFSNEIIYKVLEA